MQKEKREIPGLQDSMDCLEIQVQEDLEELKERRVIHVKSALSFLWTSVTQWPFRGNQGPKENLEKWVWESEDLRGLKEQTAKQDRRENQDQAGPREKRVSHVLSAPLSEIYPQTCSLGSTTNTLCLKERRVKRGQARKASRGSLVLWAYQGRVEKRALQVEKELMGSRESLDQGDTVERMGKGEQREIKDFQELVFLVLKEKKASVVCATHRRSEVGTPISKCPKALVNQALLDCPDLQDKELMANRVHRVLQELKEKRE